MKRVSPPPAKKRAPGPTGGTRVPLGRTLCAYVGGLPFLYKNCLTVSPLAFQFGLVTVLVWIMVCGFLLSSPGGIGKTARGIGCRADSAVGVVPDPQTTPVPRKLSCKKSPLERKHLLPRRVERPGFHETCCEQQLQQENEMEVVASGLHIDEIPDGRSTDLESFAGSRTAIYFA